MRWRAHFRLKSVAAPIRADIRADCRADCPNCGATKLLQGGAPANAAIYVWEKCVYKRLMIKFKATSPDDKPPAPKAAKAAPPAPLTEAELDAEDAANGKSGKPAKKGGFNRKKPMNR